MSDFTLYQLIKTLHILSAMIILGTGFGTAFYLFVPIAVAVSLPNRSSAIGCVGRIFGLPPLRCFFSFSRDCGS